MNDVFAVAVLDCLACLVRVRFDLLQWQAILELLYYLQQTLSGLINNNNNDNVKYKYNKIKTKLKEVQSRFNTFIHMILE